jgi:hypothetical protein
MEEESEIPPVEEQLAPETVKPTKLNKNGQPRKQLTPEAREKLAKAREKANAIRQQTYAKKLDVKLKVAKEKSAVINPNDQEENALTDKNETTNEAPSAEPAEVKEVVDEKVKPKGKGKKKTKIIVEQSSDDSDEFEPNDHVVFVKRVSRKKKEVTPPSEPPQAPPPPPEPPPLVRQPPELTPQQRILKSQYESMFGGGFMNQNNLMRRHY